MVTAEKDLVLTPASSRHMNPWVCHFGCLDTKNTLLYVRESGGVWFHVFFHPNIAFNRLYKNVLHWTCGLTVGDKHGTLYLVGALKLDDANHFGTVWGKYPHNFGQDISEKQIFQNETFLLVSGSTEILI